MSDSEIWMVDWEIVNSNRYGIHVSGNSANPTTISLLSGVFKNNAQTSLYLDTAATSSKVNINNVSFENGTSSQTGVTYNGGTFKYIVLNFQSCAFNQTGTFTRGFDFTRSDGRDANIVFLGCVGSEDKLPHAKINLTTSTTSTAVIVNTWTVASYTNTTTYTNKWTIGNNRMTFQPANPHDCVMWFSGSLYISSNGTKEVEVAIVKNGNSTTVYGQTAVTVDQNGRKFTFSGNAYLDSVSNGNYFEIWVRNKTNGDSIVVSDLTWYTQAN